MTRPFLYVVSRVLALSWTDKLGEMCNSIQGKSVFPLERVKESEGGEYKFDSLTFQVVV